MTRARRLTLVAVPLLVAAGLATAVVLHRSGKGGEAAVTTTTVPSGARSARCTEGPLAAPDAARVIAPKTPQVIEVSDQGFAPADLIAVRGFEIIWKNTSGSPRAIHFDNYSSTTDVPIESAPIPPGGSWTWCPGRGGSIVYSSPSIPGVRGHFQVMDELKPGQSPL